MPPCIYIIIIIIQGGERGGEKGHSLAIKEKINYYSTCIIY